MELLGEADARGFQQFPLQQMRFLFDAIELEWLVGTDH